MPSGFGCALMLCLLTTPLFLRPKAVLKPCLTSCALSLVQLQSSQACPSDSHWVGRL